MAGILCARGEAAAPRRSFPQSFGLGDRRRGAPSEEKRARPMVVGRGHSICQAASREARRSSQKRQMADSVAGYSTGGGYSTLGNFAARLFITSASVPAAWPDDGRLRAENCLRMPSMSFSSQELRLKSCSSDNRIIIHIHACVHTHICTYIHTQTHTLIQQTIIPDGRKTI